MDKIFWIILMVFLGGINAWASGGFPWSCGAIFVAGMCCGANIIRLVDDI